MERKTISLNFTKQKHYELLQWIHDEADEREMSVSSFCISILKEKWKEIGDDDG